MIVRGQRVDGAIIWGLGVRLRRPAMPKAWRRSGHPADGDRTLLAATALHLRLPGDIPSAEAPLATAQPLLHNRSWDRFCATSLAHDWRASNSSPPSTPRSGGARRRCISRARPKGLEPAQTNRHPTPNRPELRRRFWSQVHVTPAYQKALDWRPERPLVIMVRGDDGAVGRAAGSVRLPQDVRRISDDPASREPRDRSPGGQRHRQLVDQSQVC